MANDYEMIPEKDFDSLKYDFEKIKKNPISASPEGKELKASIDSLNESITNLLSLFKNASDSIKSESHDTDALSKKMMPLFDKVERLSEQNEKIAKGIVALADMVDELKAKQQTPLPPPQRTERPRQTFEQPQQPMNFGFPPQRTESFPPQMPQPPNFGQAPPDDFQNPINPEKFNVQPLPRMQMPSPPPQTPQKKKMFGF